MRVSWRYRATVVFVWLAYPNRDVLGRCANRSRRRSVSTKAPAMAGALIISSLTSRCMCCITGYLLSLAPLNAVSVGAHHYQGPLTPDQTQLFQCLGDRVGILQYIGGGAQISFPVGYLFDAGSLVAFEDCAVFREGVTFAASFSGCQSESFAPRSTSSKYTSRSNSKATLAQPRVHLALPGNRFHLLAPLICAGGRYRLGPPAGPLEVPIVPRAA